MWEEVGSSVLEQRVWEQMMPMEEKVESSLPGTEDGGATCCVYGREWSLVLLVWKRGNCKVSLWERVGPSFPGAEDLETVQGLCRIV